MIDPRQPGTRSFFAGQLAAWSRHLSTRFIGAFARREVITALTITDRREYERYCGQLLVNQLAHEIVKQTIPMSCKTDEEKLVERHSIEVVVLTKDEYRRLQSDLLHAAQVIEDLAR